MEQSDEQKPRGMGEAGSKRGFVEIPESREEQAGGKKELVG